MRKSQLKGQQVSLNSYFQKPSVTTTSSPPVPSATSHYSNNPFSAYQNPSDHPTNSSDDNFAKNSYMKRSNSDIDRNPAVAKKQRVLPKTVKLQQAPPPKPQSDYNLSSSSSYRRSSSSSPAFYNYSHKKEDEESDSVLNTDNPQKQELLNKSFQLSSSQKAALEAIMQRKSVFYTGAAGKRFSLTSKFLLTFFSFQALGRVLSYLFY